MYIYIYIYIYNIYIYIYIYIYICKCKYIIYTYISSNYVLQLIVFIYFCSVRCRKTEQYI